MIKKENMMKKLFSIALLATAFSSPTFASPEGELHFGVDPSYPPYEWKKADGSLTGFDIDIGNAICKELEVKCVWVETSFDGIIPALKVKKFDAILSALVVNEKRLKQIDFTDKISQNSDFLIAKKESIKSAEAKDLKGMVVGAEQGSIQSDYAKAHYAKQGIKVKAYASSQQLVQDLKNGRVNAAVMSGAVADSLVFEQEGGDKFTAVGSALKDEKIQGNSYIAIGVRKGDAKTKGDINKAIAAILEDGSYKTISKKYFSFDTYGG